jgi:hypothetical protein
MMPPRFPVEPIGVRPGPIQTPYPVAPIPHPIASPVGNEQSPLSGLNGFAGGSPGGLAANNLLPRPGAPPVSGAYPVGGPPITSPMPGPMPFRGGPMFPGGNPGMQPGLQFGGQMPPFNLVNLAQLLANKQRGF